MSSFVPIIFGGIVLFGNVVGLPDIGWIGLVVTGTWWLNSKFNKMERRFDKLPCNCDCPVENCPQPHKPKHKPL